MPLIINELHRRGLKFPVLVGGAAINRRFGRRILFTEDGNIHEPGVFYCKDAFEGLETMDQLIVPEKREELLARVRKEGDLEMGRTSQVPEHRKRRPAPRSSLSRSSIRSSGGSAWSRICRWRSSSSISASTSFIAFLGREERPWREWEKLKAEFEARLEKMTKEALRYKWLKPQGVYGYFPCQSDGDDLILYHPDTVNSASPDELTRFSFPRQPYDDHLALSDYFAPVDSGKLDVVAFQVVTVGQEATERFDKLQADHDYTEAYFTHGLAVQTAEATADYLHQHIRRELGIRRKPGQALFLGLSCHSRAGGSQESV